QDLYFSRSRLYPVRLDPGQGCAFDCLGARDGRHLPDDAVDGRCQAELHLHRLHEGDQRALLYQLARLNEHGDDLAIHRCPHHSVPTNVAGIWSVMAHQCHMILTTTGNNDGAVTNVDDPVVRRRSNAARDAVDRDLSASWSPSDADLSRHAVNQNI